MTDRYQTPDPTVRPTMFALVPCARCGDWSPLQLATAIYRCRTCPDGGRPAPESNR